MVGEMNLIYEDYKDLDTPTNALSNPGNGHKAFPRYTSAGASGDKLHFAVPNFGVLATTMSSRMSKPLIPIDSMLRPLTHIDPSQAVHSKCASGQNYR